MPRSDVRILLASRSPRRRELLDSSGLAHETIDSRIDDSGLPAPAVAPAQWVMALAYLKARSGWASLNGPQGAVVLGADTVVVKGDSIIGQPRNESEARDTVRRLNNGSHVVATGVAMIDDRGERLVWVDTARVRVGDVPESVREAYLRTDSWRGKAGAYNFADRLADGWPISCEDDQTTVMGLPMKMLPDILDRFIARASREGAQP